MSSLVCHGTRLFEHLMHIEFDSSPEPFCEILAYINLYMMCSWIAPPASASIASPLPMFVYLT